VFLTSINTSSIPKKGMIPATDSSLFHALNSRRRSARGAGAFPASPPQIAIKRALAVIAAAPQAAKGLARRPASLNKAMRSPVTNERGDDEGSYFGGWPRHAHQ